MIKSTDAHQPANPHKKQTFIKLNRKALIPGVFLFFIILCSLLLIVIPNVNTHPTIRQSSGLATAIPAYIGSTTSSITSASSLTWSYTVGSQTNQVMVVGISIPQGGVNVSSVSYAGVNLTQAVAAGCPGSKCDTEQWYLVNPPQGTNNVVVTVSGIADIDAGAATFSDVDQSNPIAATTQGKGSSPPVSDTIATTTNQVAVDSFVDTGGNAGWTPFTGQTQIWGAGNGVAAGSSYTNGINGNTTMGWTNSASGSWEHAVIALSGLPPPTIPVSPTDTPTPTPTPVFNLTANVFVDSNTNGTKDHGEGNYQGAQITLSGNSSSTSATDVNGNVTFGNLIAGSYGVNLTVPSGYASTTPTSQLVTITNSDVFTQFGIFQIPPLAGCAQAQPADIMMIFDLSGSMQDKDPSTGNPKIDEAKKAGSLFVQIMAQNQPNARIGITVLEGSYNWGTKQAVTYLLSPFTNNYNQLLSLINGMQADTAQKGSNTCFDCAIYIGNQEYATGGRAGVKNITIFLTDGLANMTYHQPGVGVNANVAEPPAMQEVQNGNTNWNIVYNTIGIGHGNGNIDEKFLQDIAYTSGGVYYNDPSQGDLESIYTSIANGNAGSAVLKGFVFNDNDLSQTFNPGDVKLAGWTVQLKNGSNTQTAVTDLYGNYSFPGLCTGSYLVQNTIQNGWFGTVPVNPDFYILNITDGNTYNENFGVHQGYTVKGSVFDDVNKDEIKDNGETNYTGGGIAISSTGGNANVYPDGSYVVSGLLPGFYLISYNSPLPKGYILVYPPPPPSFLVTVGPGTCFIDTSHGASCDKWGNILNLNFAISNSIPWMQTYGLDVRMENGFTDDVPQNPRYPPYALAQDPSANTPGVLFPGNSSVDSGSGQISSTGWIAGGGAYPEVFSPPNGEGILTSFQVLSSQIGRAGITPTDLTNFPTCSSLSNCTLPPGLPSGAYIANGDTVLNGYNFPAASNYIFLVNGNLTINGNMLVPNGSTVIFSSSKDINVATLVGTAPVSPLPPGQLQGIYSADGNVTILGINKCTIGADKMLNMEGALIVNAAHTGGTFTNNRDLCGSNPNIPSFTIKDRLDFLLNAPAFLLQGTTTSHEDAP